MDKEIVEVPVVSDAVRRAGVPLSPVVKANGFVFVSGLPGIDLATGKFVDGDIEAQTEASLRAVRHALEAAGSSLEKVVKATVYVSNAAHFAKVNRVYAPLPRQAAGPHLRHGGLLAAGVRHRNRVRRLGVSAAPPIRRKTMPAYLIANLDVKDAQRFEEYRAKVPAVIAKHGGRYLVRGGALHPMEGDFGLKRLVVLEFPSVEAAKGFYDSADYAPLLRLRMESTESAVVLVDGWTPS